MELKFYVIRQVVTSAQLSLNSLTVFQEYRISIIIDCDHENVDNYIYLVRQHLGPGLLSLLLVDELHEDPLVLEHITLGLQVKFVVQVTVNLLGLPENIQLH